MNLKTLFRLVWIGGDLCETPHGVIVHSLSGALELECPEDVRDWVVEVVEGARPEEEEPLLFSEARARFPRGWKGFACQWEELREAGLLLI